MSLCGDADDMPMRLPSLCGPLPRSLRNACRCGGRIAARVGRPSALRSARMCRFFVLDFTAVTEAAKRAEPQDPQRPAARLVRMQTPRATDDRNRRSLRQNPAAGVAVVRLRNGAATGAPAVHTNFGTTSRRRADHGPFGGHIPMSSRCAVRREVLDTALCPGMPLTAPPLASAGAKRRRSRDG